MDNVRDDKDTAQDPAGESHHGGMKFPGQDSGVPVTQAESTEPEEPSRSRTERAGGGAGPDHSPSFQTGVPSEGVSESTPGDGL